ncbi:tRNA lysidine(34) synthetase TilS [Clostridium sp.]|uniref:tRNA lysidine(34) synthetase TilS n=1 Tax=Clostridium sp. TaxID=1506 RepID=UPI00262BFEEF|nr:tRNA lysidine(34) synthetase TilS [Clostridium sp.]
MIEKVKEFIIKNSLINREDKVLVALSGGPDSVCLLHCLYRLKKDFNIKVGAAHVNHMLRGKASLEDEEYSRKLCEELGIDFYSREIDISEIAKKKGISIEMAGREARYNFFEKIKKENNYNCIAVAHNENDQAETVLMNLMRGTGIEGLCGIRAKRSGNIIRPILCLSRLEIEKYCEEKHLNPRIDKTNLENIYSRNKIRLDILPYMKENFNEDIIKTINRMSKLIQVDNDFIEKESKRKYQEYCLVSDENIIIKKEAFYLDKAIITRIIKRAFFEFSGVYNNFEMKHIYEVLNLSGNTTNKKIFLPNKIISENVYGDIYLKKRNVINSVECIKEALTLEKSSVNRLSTMYGNYIINLEVINCKNNIEFSNNLLIKYFDYDTIEEKLEIREKVNGDRITPLGMKGSKKLKDVLIDLKVPIEERKEIPIVTFDDEIAWVVGYKVSEKFKVKKETKKILKIIFTRKEC